MMFSIDCDHCYFESDMFFPSAPKKRYVLEKFPSEIRHTPEYNTLQYTFRPITPPKLNQQQQHQHQNRYIDTYKPSKIYYSDNEQKPINLSTKDKQQNLSSFQRNIESFPNSEIGIVMDKLGGDTKENKDLEAGIQPKKSRRRRLLNNLLDFLAIAATCLIFGLIYLLVKPVQRGFYCDDTSIQYPFKPDTIPMWLLGVYGGIGPIIIFLIVEIWVVRPFQCGRRSNKTNLKQRQIDYLKTIFQTAFLFVLGIAICFLITEVGKRTIGRLRPYYITICNPIWAQIQCTKTLQTASGPLVVSQYITNHRCDSTAPARDIQEAKLSFPSGHASYSTYAFVFLFVYFEARLVCPNIQFLKPFLQCLCIAVAFFTSLSRVTDNKHHATDVIGGAIIGFCIAVFAAIRVGTYLWSFGVYCETVDETKKERLPEDERVPIPGIETKQSGALRSNDQIQLENTHEQRQPPIIHSRNNTRSHYDSGISVIEQKNTLNSKFHGGGGGRRVSPNGVFEGPNN
ncbi:unnamed protein product [Rotaria sordida]|uniref:Phosphatidic acid phosphatase type 2/haloperoxidase domain-containing protein n=1 Tax=Rotaria sordida TaxID=392033 RepID=A0A819HGG2_9BILA|nr:unnamed protein product [Rotaria sordida]